MKIMPSEECKKKKENLSHLFLVILIVVDLFYFIIVVFCVFYLI